MPEKMERQTIEKSLSKTKLNESAS